MASEKEIRELVARVVDGLTVPDTGAVTGDAGSGRPRGEGEVANAPGGEHRVLDDRDGRRPPGRRPGNAEAAEE